VGLAFCSAISVLAQSTNRISVEDLRHLHLPDVLLESVEPVAADLQKNPNAKGYLRVNGVIGGNIRFELLLPDAWNGRFVMGGSGQAMMEASRYLQYFDGIVAGGPAFNWTGFAATMVSIAKALYPNPDNLDSTVLTKEALEKLQAAILEQCDQQDGLKDGIIED